LGQLRNDLRTPGIGAIRSFCASRKRTDTEDGTEDATPGVIRVGRVDGLAPTEQRSHRSVPRFRRTADQRHRRPARRRGTPLRAIHRHRLSPASYGDGGEELKGNLVVGRLLCRRVVADACVALHQPRCQMDHVADDPVLTTVRVADRSTERTPAGEADSAAGAYFAVLDRDVALMPPQAGDASGSRWATEPRLLRARWHGPFCLSAAPVVSLRLDKFEDHLTTMTGRSVVFTR
jgi:hypothetical protein